MFSLNMQLQKDLSCFLFNNVWNPYGLGEKLENMTQKKLQKPKEKKLTYFFKKNLMIFWRLTHYFACLGLDILKVKKS